MLSRALAPRAEAAFTLFRITAGLMFSVHGAQKLLGVLTDQQPPPGSQLWFGGIIELTTGIAIAAGLFTTIAGVLASGTMAVAYLQFHWRFELGDRFFPVVNKGELALLYSVSFLFIACRGAGWWSLDRLFAGQAQPPAEDPRQNR